MCRPFAGQACRLVKYERQKEPLCISSSRSSIPFRPCLSHNARRTFITLPPLPVGYQLTPSYHLPLDSGVCYNAYLKGLFQYHNHLQGIKE